MRFIMKRGIRPFLKLCGVKGYIIFMRLSMLRMEITSLNMSVEDEKNILLDFPPYTYIRYQFNAVLL